MIAALFKLEGTVPDSSKDIGRHDLISRVGMVSREHVADLDFKMSSVINCLLTRETSDKYLVKEGGGTVDGSNFLPKRDCEFTAKLIGCSQKNLFRGGSQVVLSICNDGGARHSSCSL